MAANAAPNCRRNCRSRLPVGGLIPAGGLEAMVVNLGLWMMIDGVWLRDCCLGWWSTRDGSETIKRGFVLMACVDVLAPINTSLLGARGLEHQDGVPSKSGVLKSA